MDTDTFEDLVQSVEVAIGKPLASRTVSELFKVVSDRIAELEGPASQEKLFDEASLELGMLKNLLAQVTSLPGATHSVTPRVH